MLSMLADKLWELLDQQSLLSFGVECQSVMAWGFLCGLVRTLLVHFHLSWLIPNAFIFSFPPLLEAFSRTSPMGKGVIPSLPLRVAESLLGRTQGLTVVIPAHLIGGVLGATAVKLVFGGLGLDPLMNSTVPIIYQYQGLALGWQMFFQEILASLAYVVAFLVLPELARINHLPMWLAWLLMYPLLVLKVPDQGACYCPGYNYALWFVNRDRLQLVYKEDSIQYEHVFGPAVGGFLAGVVMIYLFPDEPPWTPL